MYKAHTNALANKHSGIAMKKKGRRIYRIEISVQSTFQHPMTGKIFQNFIFLLFQSFSLSFSISLIFSYFLYFFFSPRENVHDPDRERCKVGGK